jgi:hypothetical protein
VTNLLPIAGWSLDPDIDDLCQDRLTPVLTRNYKNLLVFAKKQRAAFRASISSLAVSPRDWLDKKDQD